MNTRSTDENSAERSAHTGVVVEDLRVGPVEEPAVDGGVRPRLAWVINGPPGVGQTAYEVRVTDPQTGTAWTTGRVMSSTLDLVEWPAPPLVPGAARRVSVRVWGSDGSGPSPWSLPVAVMAGEAQRPAGMATNGDS